MTRVNYKNKRGSRSASLETDYSLGMQYSEGTIDNGYVKNLVNFDYVDNNTILAPRAALITDEYILPIVTDSDATDSVFNSEGITVKDVKECVEDGKKYRQFILGGGYNLNEGFYFGNVYISTSEETDNVLEVNNHDIKYSAHDRTSKYRARFNVVKPDNIHNVRLTEAQIAELVGTFGFNNNYYFIGRSAESSDEQHYLQRTVFNKNTKKYEVEQVTVKDVSASEAVDYGYNMLKLQPYIFNDKVDDNVTVLQMEGILPYDGTFKGGNVPNLKMTPKKSERVFFRLNYWAKTNSKYRFIWEWKTANSDDWTKIDEVKMTEAFSETHKPVLEASFKVPADAIMVRVQAYNTSGEVGTDATVVEKVMTVGFDFTEKSYGNSSNLTPEKYYLAQASGMTYWSNRLVMWGLKQDPTILFMSDLNEPGYFPYPNNVCVFDDPIICVKDFMGSLVVFTTKQILTVSLGEDGASWKTTVMQSNLNITEADKHLIQVVRNMLFFKSGMYYYMMVPKAESTTGELVIAPISSNITEFFNNFSANVRDVFENTYGKVPTSDIITFYNFLDYESIHNMYVFKDTTNDLITYVHFDMEYNTVARYWKINVYESPHILSVFRNDATQKGLLVSTSTREFYDVYSAVPGAELNNLSSQGVLRTRRVIQTFRFDPLSVIDFYITDKTFFEESATSGVYIYENSFKYGSAYQSVTYNAANEAIMSVNYSVKPLLPDYSIYQDLNQISLPSSGRIANETIVYVGKASNFKGYSVESLVKILGDLFDNPDKYYKFKNWQYLDTGYRKDDLQYQKRYRELQLQLNNIDYSDLQFGMDFLIDGEIRKTIYKYEVSQVIDELDNNYNLAYVDLIPYMDVPTEEIVRDNLWTLNMNPEFEENDLKSEIKIWKVRACVTGKGTAPRLKLYSRNEVRYQLLGVNWVYRVMNAR